MHRRAYAISFDLSKGTAEEEKAKLLEQQSQPAAKEVKPATQETSTKSSFTKENANECCQWCVVITLCIGCAIGLSALFFWLLIADPSFSSVGGAVNLALLSLPPSNESCPFAVSHALPAGLDAMRTIVRNGALNAAAISWSEYEADVSGMAGRHVLLRQEDFAEGTLRIRSSGLFTLEEDVIFSPNPNFDHFPNLPDQNDLYAGPAYILGFFAAIAVEASNVVIDLNGYELRQSNVFAAEQRFFACIELADQPFLGGQGPAMFGADTITVDGLVIENGTLGRSSHHGLHGNGGKRVLLQDLTISDYEVAAIALNGFTDVLVRRVVATGTFTNIPVLGTYSNARFLALSVQRILQADVLDDAHTLEIQSTFAELQMLMNQVKMDIEMTGRIRGTRHPEAFALFDNPTGLCDGTSYGMLFHPIGVAVNAFWHKRTPKAGAPGCVERIFLQNVVINATKASIVEVVALVAPNGAPVRGPFGDVLRVIDNVGRIRLFDDAIGTYNGGNALSRVQTAILDAALSVANVTVRKAVFGTTNGDRNTLAWLRGALPLADLITRHNHTYQRNGDTMFHVNKGVIALRLDAVRDSCLSRVSVLNTENSGVSGIVYALPGEANDVEAAYTGQSDGGHPLQGLQYGYMGADTRGLSMSATNNLCLERVVVDNVTSYIGDARAIDLFNFANTTFSGSGCAARNIFTHTESGDAVAMGQVMMGPKIGAAIGVRTTATAAASVYGLTNITVTNVFSRVFEQASFIVIDASPEYKNVPVVEDQAVNSYGL